MKKKWIGVDFDGTLAHHVSGESFDILGAPIPIMINRVKRWIKEGWEVRVVTARVSSTYGDSGKQKMMIRSWCVDNIGTVLHVTAEKDGEMIELWDDRAVAVENNTGQRLSPSRVVNDATDL